MTLRLTQLDIIQGSTGKLGNPGEVGLQGLPVSFIHNPPRILFTLWGFIILFFP